MKLRSLQQHQTQLQPPVREPLSLSAQKMPNSSETCHGWEVKKKWLVVAVAPMLMLKRKKKK